MTNKEAIKYLQQLYPNGGHCWLDEQRIEAIGMAIKALQEEPKECMYSKDNYTDEDRKVLCEDCKEKCAYAIAGVISTNAQNKKEPASEIDFEAEVKKLWEEINTGHSYSIVDSYNIFYGLCMDIADWQKEQQNIIEPTGEEQVKESLISKHEDKTCKENGNFLTQESVNEDLEEAAIQFATDTETGKVDVVKQSSFFWGAIYHKQQLMPKAVDVTIAIPYQNGYGGYTQLVDSKEGLPFGDNIKVLVIKED